MTIRHLTQLGALVAAALLTFGCGGDGDGLSVDMALLDAVTTTVWQAAGEEGDAEAADVGGLHANLAYPVDHLVELAAMPPTIPDILGSKAITDMLEDGLDAPAVGQNGATGVARHETGSDDDSVTENAAATSVPQRDDAREVRETLGEDPYVFSYHLVRGYDALLDVAFFPASDILSVTNVSGRGATATWRGRMVAQDLDADADTATALLTGNANITAHLGPGIPGAWAAAGADHLSLIDVALTDIISASGEAARVRELTWSNLDLMAAAPGGAAVTFHKNSEISGLFYDGGDDVMGRFDKEDIAGVFRAAQYEAMVDTGLAGR